MAKNIMCSIISRHLPKQLTIKTLLFAIFTVLFLPACGIKGDLYQTPAERPKDEATGGLVVAKKTMNISSVNEHGTLPLTEQATTLPIEQEKEQ